MAQLTIIFWRDIPAQLIVKSKSGIAKRQLPDRFQEAVDKAAMRARANETDDYLNDWRHGDPEPCGDDCEIEADKAKARLEADYDDTRLKRLFTSGGWKDEE